tara:strand:- start:9 stop:740 length:732 start_codon:yes stop_codon:yes gene_type:complete
MLLPWQIISKLFSLNFIYKIDFDFDHQKILEEYYEAKNKLSNINHPGIGIDHDGGWEVVSLYSQTGDAATVEKKADVITKPTEIIKYFPYTHEVIKKLLKKYDCKPRRIRFSTLKAKKRINWHRDWDESIEYNNSRLHLPLVVNKNVYSYLCHERYQWNPGGLFYGDYSFPHQIVNHGRSDRIHLIIDLKDPKNLFEDSKKFYQEEVKRKKYKKLVILIFYIFFKYPRKIFWLLTFNNPKKKN